VRVRAAANRLLAGVTHHEPICCTFRIFVIETGVKRMQNLLVTGGAGFIGCNFVRYMLERYSDYHIVVYDKLTYAGRLENLQDIQANHARRFDFVRGDICDAAAVDATIGKYAIDTIVNFAAETHVDRSIMDPDAFIQTDV
jgi:dTDP-glucose 4,6-dehydratase